VGSVAGELVDALLREASAVERKVDQLLETPLKAASIHFREVAHVIVRVQDERELIQCEQRLQDASRELAKAEVHAVTLGPDAVRRVRILQALVSALTGGGAQFARRALGDLQALREQILTEAETLRPKVSRARSERDDAARMFDWNMQRPGEFADLAVPALGWGALSAARDASRLEAQLRDMEAAARALDDFSQLVEQLIQYRANLSPRNPDP
jgi:hypothetical protein